MSRDELSARTIIALSLRDVLAIIVAVGSMFGVGLWQGSAWVTRITTSVTQLTLQISKGDQADEKQTDMIVENRSRIERMSDHIQQIDKRVSTLENRRYQP